MGKNKRSLPYYIQVEKRQKKNSVLSPNMVGFLCTCNSHERDCVREAYNILNEYADNLYGEEISESACSGDHEDVQEENKDDRSASAGGVDADSHNADSDNDGDDLVDIEAAIKADVTQLKEKNEKGTKHRRFQQVFSGAKNCIFIKTTIEDPLPLSLAIMDDLLLTQKQKTKQLLRMIPVHGTCKANPDDIKKMVEKLAASYFKDNPKSYCIVVKVRNNTTLKKEHMVSDLVNIINKANQKNKADLIDPEVVLGVNIMRKACCLSFLPHYFTKYSKYNLVLLADKKKTVSQDSLGKIGKETPIETDAEGGVEVDTGNSDKIDKAEPEGCEDKSEAVSESNVNKVEKEITTETDAKESVEVDTENK